jgi:N6-adenosine-specific RNA methylase IME4
VDQAASVVGTNRQYVSDMKRYKEEAPEVYQKAKEGKVNGSQAKAIADLPAEKRKEVIERIDAGEELTASKIKTEHTKEERRNRSQDLPTIDGEKVYNVIYADPPWEYSNTGVHGAAEHHYNTMPIDKIETLLSDIGLNVDKNAVLFMWVTNPILVEGFQIVEKWGFKYKTNMVWVKTELKKPGSGFYVRGRHELLFIATRGSFTPLDEHISPPIGSVVEHPILEHSRKPECFYQVIERLYPGCNYIELFARSSRSGWDTWGNETEKFVRSTENVE